MSKFRNYALGALFGVVCGFFACRNLYRTCYVNDLAERDIKINDLYSERNNLERENFKLLEENSELREKLGEFSPTSRPAVSDDENRVVNFGIRRIRK